VSEYQYLGSAIGWSSVANDAKAEMILRAALFAVVAEDEPSHKVIGSALLLGDNASFYYVKDVMVHPDWQGKRIGTALMQEINHWLDRNGADNALVSLISREGLAPFYRQFGFVQTFGMIKYIQRNK
jgi:GNAT superfamily N-acetyltransferase